MNQDPLNDPGSEYLISYLGDDVPAEIIGRLFPSQRVALCAAAAEWEEHGGKVGSDAVRGAVAQLGDRCGQILKRDKKRPWKIGTPCPKPAGQGTWHLGFGRCVAHGGAKLPGRALGAWLMAHKFAVELEVSPWEGLLKAVRIAAGRVAYIEWVLSQAKDDLELEDRFATRVVSADDDGSGGVPGTTILLHPDTGEPLGVGEFRRLGWWVQQGELWTDRLAKYSKAAIDAGVAEQVVQAQRLQVTLMARPVNAALSALGLTAEQEQIARAAMRRELQAIEAERTGIIDGSMAMDGDLVRNGKELA